MAIKRMVLATNLEGSPCAVGPVYTDESLDRLVGEVEDAGWTFCGTAVCTSVRDFRAEVRSGRTER